MYIWSTRFHLSLDSMSFSTPSAQTSCADASRGDASIWFSSLLGSSSSKKTLLDAQASNTRISPSACPRVRFSERYDHHSRRPHRGHYSIRLHTSSAPSVAPLDVRTRTPSYVSHGPLRARDVGGTDSSPPARDAQCEHTLISGKGSCASMPSGCIASPLLMTATSNPASAAGSAVDTPKQTPARASVPVINLAGSAKRSGRRYVSRATSPTPPPGVSSRWFLSSIHC